MNTRRKAAQWLAGCALLLLAVAELPRAGLLPGPAVRFVQYFEASKDVDAGVGLWERVMYSLVLATTRPGK
ncbi:MAG: hypothetical protein ACK5AZ_09975 [Bryobacteraceae bacterium]